jgi:hypothetical protein
MKERDVLPFPKLKKLIDIFVNSDYGNQSIAVINMVFLLLESNGQCQN